MREEGLRVDKTYRSGRTWCFLAAVAQSIVGSVARDWASNSADSDWHCQAASDCHDACLACPLRKQMGVNLKTGVLM